MPLLLGRLVLGSQVTSRPKQSADDEIQVAIILHGLILMSQGSAKNPRLVWPVQIGPCDDSRLLRWFCIGVLLQCFFVWLHHLLAFDQHTGP